MNLDSMNLQQKKAIMHVEGPLLVLAGAGSGKTRVLTHRVAYLIDEYGINPWNILAITFTNKAAQEMRERVDDIVGFGSEQIWVATFHATCVRILRRYIDRLGYDTHFTIYDTDDQKKIIKEACKKLQIDTKQFKERSLLAEISSAKNEMISPEEYRLNNNYDFAKQTIAKVYDEYQKTLKKNNALDFDDLLLKTVELFKSQGDVLNQYQERFKFIMVDEYQDTNTVQFELVRLLADKYRNLCVVGDDDQSIYKFRGANIRNILDFEKVYPEAVTIKLEQNYRSTGNILNAANGVVRHNRGRKEKALWTASEEGEKLRYKQFNTGYDEAEFVVDDILNRKRQERLNYNDFAILYRTNQQSRLLEERMVVEGVPYRLVGGVNFYSRVEIKDILAYLKTVANGLDDLAVKRIINIPKRGIGQASINKIDEYAERLGISFYDAILQCENIPGIGKTADKLNNFATTISVLRAKAEFCGIVDMIQEVMEQVSYEAYLEENYDEDFADRKENVGEFINKATVYEQTHDEISLEDFLEEVALVADVDSLDQNNDTVVLMTIHGSKGLEFNHVYLVGMEDGLFPSYMSINSDDESDLEEERRLCYVGITRARETLVMTNARSRMMNGTTQYNQVSRFVNEVPRELFETPPSIKPAFSQFGGSDYVDDGYERSYGESFVSKKVGREQYNSDGFGKSYGSGSFGSGYGGSYGSRSDSTVSGSGSYDSRPKAVLKPKVTATPNKPYILKNIENMKGVSKGMAETVVEGLEYKEGDRVKHIKFGEGTVIAMTLEKRDYKVTVQFDLAGQKIMYASFAKLQKIE